MFEKGRAENSAEPFRKIRGSEKAMEIPQDGNLQSVIQLYGHGETPTLLVGKDFEVLWANDAAIGHPSILTQFDGIRSMLSDIDLQKLKEELAKGKEFLFPEGELSFLQARVELIPLRKTEKDFDGAVMRIFFDNGPESVKNIYETQKHLSAFISQFRSPISSIYTVLIPLAKRMREQGDHAGLDYLNVISQNSYKILRTTIQIAELTRYQTGTNRLDKEYASLSEFLKELCDAVSIFAMSLGVMIRFERQNDEIFTCFDRDKLSYAVLNVLLNSCEYGAKNVMVNLKRNGGLAIIYINDDGDGISEEVLSRIFEPYYSKNSKHEMFHSLGVGLTLTRYTVAAHGGNVTIESKPETGTTVVMTLPICKCTKQDRHTDYLYQTMDHYMSDKFSPVHIMFGAATGIFHI